MAKGLPYFKFTVTEWLTGDIVYESFEVQGLFINICALYWQRDGDLTIEDVEKRYRLAMANHPLTGRFIHAKNGKISIHFLDEQFTDRNFKSVKNKENGRKGGIAKSLKNRNLDGLANANQTLSEGLANKNKNKNKNKEEEKNKIREQVTLTQIEFNKLISEHGEEATNWMLDKLNAYKLSNGKKYKSDYGAILNWVVKSYKEHKESNKDESNPLINAINEMYKKS